MVDKTFTGKIRSKWRRISVASKLYLIFGTMALFIGFELLILSFAMSTLSSVRALVAGEGQWSKGQKDSINSLYKYIITSDSHYYLDFQKHLEIPLGDRLARLELNKKNPDSDLMFKGFLLGNNHPADIAGMTELLQNFSSVSYIRDSLEAWKAGDNVIDELITLGEEIHLKIQNQNLSQNEIKEAITNLDEINRRLTIQENIFSNSLGQGSRWLEKLLLIALLLLVLTVEFTGLIFTFTFSRNLSKGLNKLKKVANRIGQGNYDHEVVVQSEDELGKLAHSINQMARQLKRNVSMRKEAEAANKTKSLFLANMSHEIRTPLSSIMGFTELLKKRELDGEDKNRYLNIIQNSGETLSNVINDILDISKVESGHLNLEKTNFSLFQLIEDLKNLLRFKCNEKNVKLIFEIEKSLPERIYSDPLRLRQILLNLLSNSIKFTNEGEIKLKASYDNHNLIFDISDTGMGIPKKDQKIIFEHFRQSGNSLTRKHGGTGLGLPLSQHLSFLLGGRIELVDSSPGVGSHFRVSIAYEKPVEKISANQNSSYQETRKPPLTLDGLEILVAEDAEDLRLLIQVILEKHGCVVDFAEDGVIAIEKAQKKTYDVILLDIQMPRLNGYDTIKKLREMGITYPILAQTAHVMSDEKAKCESMGFNEILTKPILPENLVAKLAKIKKSNELPH